ncbi:transcription elongation regulator 1-like protein, partial [Carlito syrichta]|uniref:Transcription elongation regulator 1-like protein n=1 Tax=Carlito syrichta TaxID=1868482 RepID=A0A3Q0DPL6_CARSF
PLPLAQEPFRGGGTRSASRGGATGGAAVPPAGGRGISFLRAPGRAEPFLREAASRTGRLCPCWPLRSVSRGLRDAVRRCSPPWDALRGWARGALPPSFPEFRLGRLVAVYSWLFGGHAPPLGLPSSSLVELVPVFPRVCPSALLAPVGKSWIDKRIPNCKIFFNNSFALDSTWVQPEESRLFHGREKPPLLANQVAVSLSRPAPASRPLPTVVLAPQPIPGGCHHSLKPISSGPTIAIATAAAAAAAAMVSVDPEGLRGPSPSSVQPCHFLTLAPIKIPLRAARFSAVLSGTPGGETAPGPGGVMRLGPSACPSVMERKNP